MFGGVAEGSREMERERGRGREVGTRKLARVRDGARERVEGRGREREKQRGQRYLGSWRGVEK